MDYADDADKIFVLTHSFIFVFLHARYLRNPRFNSFAFDSTRDLNAEGSEPRTAIDLNLCKETNKTRL